MQNAKDSFYMCLRARLAALNPERTVVLRGSVRPGVVVEEAESPFAQPPDNVFVLRWCALGMDAELASNMAAMECEIAWGTCGSQSFGGLDRGRVMAAMDAELAAMLQPASAAKTNYAVNPPAPMLTQVFWDEPVFTPVATQRDRLSRSARVMVYSYQEPGE
jgi:hypothetical protein